MNWIEQLKILSPSQLAVEHEPETPRYARARSKLRYILNHGHYLGNRSKENHQNEIEVAIWVPAEHRRNFGYYGCFRIYLNRKKIVFAVLFCFYDGTEKSPGFRSVHTAQTYALSEGFEDNIL